MSYHISWVRGSEHCRLQVARPMTIEAICADTGISMQALYEANPELSGDYVMDGDVLRIPVHLWPEHDFMPQQDDVSDDREAVFSTMDVAAESQQADDTGGDEQSDTAGATESPSVNELSEAEETPVVDTGYELDAPDDTEKVVATQIASDADEPERVGSALDTITIHEENKSEADEPAPAAVVHDEPEAVSTHPGVGAEEKAGQNDDAVPLQQPSLRPATASSGDKPKPIDTWRPFPKSVL